MFSPGNGQWVRTRTQRDAESFLAEQDMDRGRAGRSRLNSVPARYFWAGVALLVVVGVVLGG